jgi:hypothetical protein
MPAHRTLTQTAIGHDAGRLPARTLGWIAVAAVLGAAAITLSVVLPAPLVLSAISILLVFTGFAIAAGLYLAGYRITRDRNCGWEFAAVLVFLGFAAALLADSGEALAVLEQMQTGASK